MNYKNFIFAMLLIIILLVLFIFWYRNYVYNYCKNDMKCLKEKLIFNLNDVNDKIIKYNNKINEVNAVNEVNIVEEVNEAEEIEGFFGGLSNWFSGSNPSNLPVSPGSLPNEDLSVLEKKINDRMKKSNNFPPTDIDGNSDDFKDADNNEILNSINGKQPVKKPNPPVLPNVENNGSTLNTNAIFNKNNKVTIPNKTPPSIMLKKPDLKSLLGKCQFYNDKCPDKSYELGNFSIQGAGSGSMLSCGNVQNTKPAKAIAQIKNNAVYEIHITDQGHGFNPSSPPKVSIESAKGHGATAEAVIDDDGFLKLIKVINPGYNYTETPNVLIDAPFMNSSCHLCCADE